MRIGFLYFLCIALVTCACSSDDGKTHSAQDTATDVASASDLTDQSTSSDTNIDSSGGGDVQVNDDVGVDTNASMDTSDVGDGDTTQNPNEPMGTVVGVPVSVLNLVEPVGVTRPEAHIRVGVPLAKGVLAASTPVGILDGGVLIASQARALSEWSDGSVRWLLVDCVTDVDADETSTLELVQLTTPLVIPQPLLITEDAEFFRIDTGPLQFEVPKGDGRVLGQVWYEGQALLTDGAERGPFLLKGGSEYRSSRLTVNSQPLANDPIDDYRDYVRDEGQEGGQNLYDPWSLSVEVEEQGPVHAVIRVSGTHLDASGMGYSTFIVRIHATRGSSTLRFDQTLIYTGAEGEGVESYGFRLPLSGTQTQIEGQSAESGAVTHLSWDSHEVNGVSAPGTAQGTISRDHGNSHSVIALRDMAELFPKALSASAEGIEVQLYPDAAPTWDLTRYNYTIDSANGETSSIFTNRGAQGLSRTDTWVWSVGAGGADETKTSEIAAVLDGGLLLPLPSPREISDARVMGVGAFWFDASETNRAHWRVDKLFKVVVDFMRINQRQEYDWFGLEDYGDIRGVFDGGNSSFTWLGLGRYGWSGNSGEPSNQLWIQYLRDPRHEVLLDAEALARHSLDQQMQHYGDASRVDDSDWSGRNREFAVGSMHRHGRQAFSGYGGLPEYSHVAGIETWYYLTGDGRARETLYEAAQFIARYGTNNPDYTALVNGIDVLSRAQAVFYDDPTTAARYGDRLDILLDSTRATTPSEVQQELQVPYLPFGLFVRGVPGLAYHHERTGDDRAAESLFEVADILSASDDPYGLSLSGANGSEFFHMQSISYAASIAQAEGRDSTPYLALAEDILALNCHASDAEGTSTISDDSLRSVPDDWTDWSFSWDEEPLNPNTPGILWIDRQITYRNDFLQDYHSYRVLLHLATIAAVVDPANARCE